MSKKFTSTIAGASILIFAFSILGRGIGFIREILFANFFGLTNHFEFYLISSVIPLTINTILLYFGQNYLIPAFFKIKEKTPELIDDFLQHNFLFFLAGGIIISLILYFFSGLIVEIYFRTEDQENFKITVNIFRLYLISIPFHFIISFLSAVKQIKFDFKSPVYSQLIFNLSFLILLIIFPYTFGIFIIPICYITGSVLQVLYLFQGVKLKFRFSKSYSLFNSRKNYITRSVVFIILIESIGQLYLISDRIFYDFVPSGGIAALNYSSIIFLLPVSIFSLALSTAIFPSFSENFNNGKFWELEKNFIQGIKINIAAFIPITFIFLFYGDSIIKLFFQRGEFSSFDTLVTYKALFFYSLSLLFYSSYTIVNKILYSADLTKELLIITVAGILLKIIFNIFLVKKMQQNGLALSTSISFIFFFFSGFYLVYNKMPFHNSRFFLSESLFHLLNTAISFLAVKIFSSIIYIKTGLFLYEILLFVFVFFLNIIVVKHSSVELFKNVINKFLIPLKNPSL